MKQSSRLCAAFNVVIGVGASAVAFYLQYAQGLAPCSLCIMQRFVVYAIILFSGIIVLTNPSTWIARTFHALSLICALAGIGLVSRHLYLQSLPEDMKPSCGPGFMYLIKHVPILKAIQSGIVGTGDCAQVQGLYFGFSLPFWTGIVFIIFAVIALVGMKSK